MKVRLPVNDVTVTRSGVTPGVREPLFSSDIIQINQDEFALSVPQIGCFYVAGGREVVYSVVQGADPEWVQLYLNGQVLVALLHQRKVINFHASSFILDGRGVMVLGDTGAGKSSLTISFVLAGAGFLSDDLTPVLFREGVPYLMPLHRRVKIREGTAVQLNLGRERLTDAEAGTGKKYLSLDRSGVEEQALHTILKIETGDVSEPMFHEPSPAEKFSLLRSEICSWEILAGMPETEASYLQQLIDIIRQVRFVRVVRPGGIRIVELKGAMEDYLGCKDKG